MPCYSTPSLAGFMAESSILQGDPVVRHATANPTEFISVDPGLCTTRRGLSASGVVQRPCNHRHKVGGVARTGAMIISDSKVSQVDAVINYATANPTEFISVDPGLCTTHLVGFQTGSAQAL
jgi:hypothetical protein